MKLIRTTKKYEYYEFPIGDLSVIFKVDKDTYDADDSFIGLSGLAKVLRYSSVKEMMSQDRVLDICNQVVEDGGDFPIDNSGYLSLKNTILLIRLSSHSLELPLKMVAAIFCETGAINGNIFHQISNTRTKL